MKSWLLNPAMLFGCAACLLLLALFVTSNVDAQGPESRPSIEYKTVTFVPNSSPNKQDHEKMLNDLARQGWEFDGLLIPPYESNGRYAPASVAVFRREKL
ncbi:MAG: DUF4177 domain-containing protein [Pirellulaceae bacterium]